jgi:hypothetical protein
MLRASLRQRGTKPSFAFPALTRAPDFGALGWSRRSDNKLKNSAKQKEGATRGALFVCRLSLEVVSVRAVETTLASGEHFLKFPG